MQWRSKTSYFKSWFYCWQSFTWIFGLYQKSSFCIGKLAFFFSIFFLNCFFYLDVLVCGSYQCQRRFNTENKVFFDFLPGFCTENGVCSFNDLSPRRRSFDDDLNAYTPPTQAPIQPPPASGNGAGGPLAQSGSDDDEQRFTADSIRSWMGDFSKIDAPHKYGARIGQVTMGLVLVDRFCWQSFSDSFLACAVPLDVIEEVVELRCSRVFLQTVCIVSRWNYWTQQHSILFYRRLWTNLTIFGSKSRVPRAIFFKKKRTV